LLISWNNCAPCHQINEEECKRNPGPLDPQLYL
jgi:hypothetical protein